MIKGLLIFGFNFLLSVSYGQNGEELNKISKEFIKAEEFGKAVPLLRQASELGISEAQYNFGVILEFGYGVESNMDSAFYWYSKSADQGWNDGIYKMMMAHAQGIGAIQSNEKAFEYALRCAKNNDISCMFNVVGAYQDGLGTNRDLEKMLEWAIRIAKLPNHDNLLKSGKITSARLNLAYMYRDGRNVELDLIKSYCWFLIYNESKKDFSFYQQESVIKEILDLEKKMTDEQISDCKIQAEKILERPLLNLSNLHKPNK